MDGAIALLLFSGFLAFLVYRMDQNESKNDSERKSYKDILEDVYNQGFNDGVNHDGGAKTVSKDKRLRNRK